MAAEVRPRTLLRWSLGRKLVLAMLVLAAALATFLLVHVGPRATRDFTATTGLLAEHATTHMHEIADMQTQASCQVLVDVIEQTTAARARGLQDLPLAVYGSGLERVRAAILTEDAARSATLQRNVEVLAREMERRANVRIAEHVARNAEEQAMRAATFADDLRGTLLLLCATVLLSGFALLGFGLFRFVVRPARLLREATQRVAAGDLSVGIRVDTGDEIGDLASAFATMVEQLRASREELERLNRTLAQEVERKTHQLVQAEKMASIGTLAGGIAHEFNNLIGGIRGCAADVRNDETDPERRETLDVIVRAADRATAITAQLLRFSRRSVEHVRDVDVHDVLDDALRLCEPAARRRSVAVERDYEGPLSLRGDADALHQVFVNLLTNALQAMPGGGTLRVEARRHDAGVEIRVADSGHGIAPEDLDRVFEPFFTKRDSEKDPELRGTGLGLSVSYGIVTAHGGTMTVQSEKGAGATFVVWLPAAPKPPAAPVSA